jgi:cell wall-associated NlpC family hydrolase
MARRALIACCCALVLAAPATAEPAAASWALPQIKIVTAHGLMGGKASGFRPDDALTAGDLGDLVAGLTGQEAPMAADPSTPVTIAQLDAQLVRALGLLPSARFFTAQVRAAGITPTRYFGTEVAARLIGLRVDHPAAQDALERGPSDVATRAEAAYSAAHILGFTRGEADWVAQQAAAFQLPVLSGNQRAILQVALSFVGYPYIWGGTSELPQDPFATGKQVPGGFDCSGFAWRVYKLQAYTGGTPGATLKGRTSQAMSGEVPRAKRIGIARLQPADLLFFGSRGAKSKPADINHMGIYLGGGWFVQASSQGVSLSPLSSPWYSKRFAWARRPLAEAGLT